MNDKEKDQKKNKKVKTRVKIDKDTQANSNMTNEFTAGDKYQENNEYDTQMSDMEETEDNEQTFEESFGSHLSREERALIDENNYTFDPADSTGYLENSQNLITLRNSIKVQTKIFNSSSLLIKDDFATITENEKKMIKYGLMSERNYETVLASKKDIRYGAASITFINLFDKVLIRSIAENSTRLGVALTNKVFVRKLAYRVLNEVIIEASQNKNRGFIKKSFQITRAHISKSVTRVLNRSIGKSKNPMRDDFIEGLAGIIEICMVAQLVNYYLFEIDDLNEKILTSVKDNLCAINDYQAFKHVIMTSNTRIAIKRILGSTSKLSRTVSDETKVSSVDNSVIVDSFMREIDLISEVLINNDIAMSDIDECMIILRIIRDRDILMLDDSLKIIVKECDNFYKANKDLLDTFLTNYDINEFLDDLTIDSIENFSTEFGGQVNSLSFKFLQNFNNIKAALSFEDSYIRIQSKEEFLQEFSIRNKRNDKNKVYHSFVRRNFKNSSNNQFFDALAQRVRASRNLLNTIPSDQESLIILNNMRGAGSQFADLLEDIHRRSVLCSEYSYFESVDNIVPEYMNAIMCQTALLKRGDIKKIAAFNSDQVLISYLDYCKDFIAKIARKIDFDINTVAYKNKTCSPIYVKICDVNATHADASMNSLGQCTIISKEPRRIVSLIDNYYGSNSIQIISNMVEKGRYAIGSLYASEALRDDFTIWPNNKSFNISVKLPEKMKNVDGFSIHVDFKKIFQPFSFNSITISNRNVYHEFCSEYCRVLSFFRSQNMSLMSNMRLNFEQLRRGFDVPDYKVVSNQQTKNDNYEENLANISYLEQGIFSTIEAFRLSKNALKTFENGSVVHKKHKSSISFSIYVPQEEFIHNSQNIGHMFARLIRYRSETNQMHTHQYYMAHLIDELYRENKFFASLVDSTLQYNGDLDGSSELYASKLLELYAFETSNENPSLFRMLSSLLMFSCFKNLARIGGDLAFIFKSKNAEKILSRVIKNNTDVDSSLLSESELIFIRKGVRLRDFTEKAASMVKPFYEQSFYTSEIQTQEYKTELLSTVIENKDLDIVAKVENVLETEE